MVNPKDEQHKQLLQSQLMMDRQQQHKQKKTEGWMDGWVCDHPEKKSQQRELKTKTTVLLNLRAKIQQK